MYGNTYCLMLKIMQRELENNESKVYNCNHINFLVLFVTFGNVFVVLLLILLLLVSLINVIRDQKVTIPSCESKRLWIIDSRKDLCKRHFFRLDSSDCYIHVLLMRKVQIEMNKLNISYKF